MVAPSGYRVYSKFHQYVATPNAMPSQSPDGFRQQIGAPDIPLAGGFLVLPKVRQVKPNCRLD
jgi:hypothetical protein